MEFADLHPNYVGGLERGERNLALIYILRLAPRLQVRPGIWKASRSFQAGPFRESASNAATLPQLPSQQITTHTKETAGGRLASSAQPPRATSVFLPWPSSLRQPQPIPSSSFLDNPGALLEGLRCFTAFRPLPRNQRFSSTLQSGGTHHSWETVRWYGSLPPNRSHRDQTRPLRRPPSPQ